MRTKTLFLLVLGALVVQLATADSLNQLVQAAGAPTCVNGDWLASANKCVCMKGYSGMHPVCTMCPVPQTSIVKPDGSSTCVCPSGQGVVPDVATGLCKCATGWYRGSAIPQSLGLTQLCTQCKQVGSKVIVENGKQVCGCNTAAGYGFSVFLNYVRGPSWPSVYCIPCTANNRKLDASGVCKCKAGFGVWGNVGPDKDVPGYCRPCTGKGYTIDAFGWCRCAVGYAIDPRTDTCVPCSGPSFTVLPPDGGRTFWNYMQCACMTGYVSKTEETGPIICEKCTGPTTAKAAVISKKRKCVCKDPQKTKAPACNVCRYGYQDDGQGWCQRRQECTGTLQLLLWPASQLPKGWSGKSFPSSVLKPTSKVAPIVNKKMDVPISLRSTEEYKAAHIPATLANKFAAQFSGCLCTSRFSITAGQKVANVFTAVVEGAQASLSISAGPDSPFEPKTVQTAAKTVFTVDVNETCVQVDLRAWAGVAPAALPKFTIEFGHKD